MNTNPRSIDTAKKQSDSITYVDTLLKDIEKIEKECCGILKSCGEVEECINLINVLSEHTRKATLLKITPKCLIPAVIVHTGEYDVQLGSDMFASYSLKETLNYLNKKYNELQSSMTLYQQQQNQLYERYKFEIENIHGLSNAPELEDMPEEIVSEKGVAYKMKSGYEIIETYVEANEVEFKKRRSRIKSNQNQVDDQSLFKRLEELELEEQNEEVNEID